MDAEKEGGMIGMDFHEFLVLLILYNLNSNFRVHRWPGLLQ